jgi:hypothetical protein
MDRIKLVLDNQKSMIDDFSFKLNYGFNSLEKQNSVFQQTITDFIKLEAQENKISREAQNKKLNSLKTMVFILLFIVVLLVAYGFVEYFELFVPVIE